MRKPHIRFVGVNAVGGYKVTNGGVGFWWVYSAVDMYMPGL